MYYPLLKNANNEMKALINLKEPSKTNLVPIIESKRIKKENTQNWEDIFSTLGTYLSTRLKGIKFIYDFNTSLEELDESIKLVSNSGNDLIEHCTQKMKDEDLNFIPCFQYDSPDWMIESVLKMSYKEIAIRIKCNKFQESFYQLVLDKINKDLSKLSNHKNIILILDFYNSDASIRKIQKAIDTFSQVNNSKIVYLATFCPENANDAVAHDFTLVNSRKEYNNYLQLITNNPNLHFGDYTVRLKSEVLSGFNHNNSYLKIFYSTPTDYWIAKSKLIKNEGEETFHEVCKYLTEQDFYPGPDFSFGDYEINRCANQEITISEHQSPIAIGVNHHIELTIYQLLEKKLL